HHCRISSSSCGSGWVQAWSWQALNPLDHSSESFRGQSSATTPNTIIQGSTDNDTQAEFEIELTGLRTLTAGDFIL
ncbi:hypothetical protein H5395_12270, partial [Paracoccus sp. MC1854]|uniref:hypothetical protein n=1 Tax=Paracoccus sp. MC1854 TaxID=2760306 RepID=UPI0017CAA6CA